MSIIAWDGKIVAADKQATEGDIRSLCRKLERIRGAIVATVGDVSHSTKLIKWYRAKGSEADFPKYSAKEDAMLIVFNDNGQVYEYGATGGKFLITDPFMAWGTGKDLALGAMAMGANAKKAAQIACKYNVTCGMGVVSYRIGPR